MAGDSRSGRSVASFRHDLSCAVLGLRRRQDDILLPADTMKLEVGDQLLILEEDDRKIDADRHEPPAKVLVVDDNPVIVRLYLRLLRKAGISTLMAASGEEAMQVMARERVDVAVIDFGLPGMSGIDVCRRVADEMGEGRPACILFTADEREETRAEAFTAGVEAVVLKSPEASDLVATVRRVISARKEARPAEQSGTTPRL